MIYLDHNATTPVLPEVVDAMLPYLREHFGNPSSGHVFGRRAKEAVELARARVACLINASAEEIIFTSGGTESNNLAIRGAAEGLEREQVVTSVIEHPATSNVCAWLHRQGFEVTKLPVDRDGRVQVAPLSEEVGLVTVMHSNNETGVLQPIAELARAAKACGALTHTDAAQSVGKVPIDVRALDVDYLSIAGHKLYAPKGVGALYVRKGAPLHPLLLGAGHERGHRPGTENVASIVGLGTACELVGRDLTEVSGRLRAQRDELHAALGRLVPGLALNGHAEARLPNTLNVRFPRVSGTALLDATTELAASTGSACHEGHESASQVILAMGVPASEAVSSVRLTLGRATTAGDVEVASAALGRAWRSLAG